MGVVGQVFLAAEENYLMADQSGLNCRERRSGKAGGKHKPPDFGADPARDKA
jgi:hypothetical protein